MNPPIRPARGAAQLLLVLSLLGLSALASAIAMRSTLSEMASAGAWAQAQQARLAAQAALASAEAELLTAYAREADPLASLANRTCPAAHAGPRWQCLTLPLSHPTLGTPEQHWHLQAWLLRDLLHSPHVLQVHASAHTPEGAATTQRVSLFAPQLAPAPNPAPGNAVVLGDSHPPQPPAPPPCARRAWRQVLGDITPAHLQAWSEAQARNGLSAHSQPARSIWWIDSPADWNTSLGDAGQAVLLVFSARACASRCPRIAKHVRIQGTVYLDAGCDDAKVQGWQSGPIVGQLVVETGLADLAASPQVRAQAGVRQAYALFWPPGTDTRRLQAVPGSRWEGP
ncbi:MAG: hypothetical protein FJY36_03760 [Betaproteobacteria bacterium]|nr:hypothetical protein [Betaproteobacteria bacterium]